MNMKRCNKGHYYDNEKYQSCPYCQQQAGPVDHTIPMGGSSHPVPSPSPSNVPPTGNFNYSDDAPVLLSKQPDNGKTIGVYRTPNKTVPVVGWLVCVKGKHRGESFRLSAGKNFIGRGNEMDVRLASDEAVSRNKHAVLLYEPKANIFIVQPGESRELTYLNNEVLLESKEIHAYDIVLVGKSELMFIPLCNDRFRWEEEEEK